MRSIAIKVLPADLAEEGNAWLDSSARRNFSPPSLIPNIAAIHGLDEPMARCSWFSNS